MFVGEEHHQMPKFNLKIKNIMKTKIHIIFILLMVASCTKSESPKPVVIEYHQAFDIVGNWRFRPYDLADYTFKKDGSYQMKYEIRYLTDTTIYGNYILSKLPKLDMWHLKFVNSQDSSEGNYIVINNNKLQDEGSVDYYFYRK